MSVTPTNSKIEAEYRARTRRSAELYAQACKVIPAGLTHDSRTLRPYPIYAARASGPRKWDVDGNEYVDYFGGHGALLLGHGHPAVAEAIQKQVPLGTHWGSSHELEVRWAELVNRLIPCAERVRGTSDGHLRSSPHTYQRARTTVLGQAAHTWPIFLPSLLAYGTLHLSHVRRNERILHVSESPDCIRYKPTDPQAAVCIRQKQEDLIGTSAQAAAMSRRCLMMRASACLPSRIRHS